MEILETVWMLFLKCRKIYGSSKVADSQIAHSISHKTIKLSQGKGEKHTPTGPIAKDRKTTQISALCQGPVPIGHGKLYAAREA